MNSTSHYTKPANQVRRRPENALTAVSPVRDKQWRCEMKITIEKSTSGDARLTAEMLRQAGLAWADE